MIVSTAKLNLAQARAQMSNKDLQRLANVSDVTLSRIRNGARATRPQIIGRIATALGVDVTEIIEMED